MLILQLLGTALAAWLSWRRYVEQIPRIRRDHLYSRRTRRRALVTVGVLRAVVLVLILVPIWFHGDH